MGLTNEKIPKLKNCFKFNEPILNILENYKNIPEYKPHKCITYRKFSNFLFKLKKYEKPPISNDLINLFYENPNEFFASYEQSLDNTSFYDDSGISIFAHYFHILYDSYQKNGGQNNDNIYENNFNAFFQKEQKFLGIQDYALETPLHKLAKFRNKKFFFHICKKLKEIDVLKEELLLINNINDESCLTYILQDIKYNKYKIIQKNLGLYQEFFNYFSNKESLLSLEEKKFMLIFSCLITFDRQKFNEVNFNDAIQSIYNLKEKNSDILNIFEFLYYPYQSGLNYLNCLFHICKSSQDFDKLYQLILDISKIEINFESTEYLCIPQHISYVLLKMNSKKSKGELEIYYGKKLLNQVLPLLIKNKSEISLINIITVRNKIYRSFGMQFNFKGICHSLVNNPNISFDQKFEMLSAIEDKLGKTFEFIMDKIDKDFLYLYRLIDAVNKNEINEGNINAKFKENIFAQKIFADFYYIGSLYRKMYKTWKLFPHININEYITSVCQFINNNFFEIFGVYKTRYNISREKIKRISELIIAFEKQNYNKNIETEELSKNFKIVKNKDTIIKKLYIQIMLTKPKYINNLLLMIQFEEEKVEDFACIQYFIQGFFSFKFEYETMFNNESLKKAFCNKEKRLLDSREFRSKFLNSLKTCKNQPYEHLYYKFILENCSLSVLLATKISEFKLLLKRYLKKLIYKWEEDCDFNDLKNFIKENILIFCFLFLKDNDDLEEIHNKIYFFFDEFINIIDPEFKDTSEIYKNLALEYLDIENKKKNTYNLASSYYLAIVLIFVRLKFGKYNPELFILVCNYYKLTYPIILSFMNSCLKTQDKMNIPYHYFFTENSLTSKDEQKLKINIINKDEFKAKNTTNIFDYLTKYLLNYSSKFHKIESSLVFEYIKQIFDEIMKGESNINNENENSNEEKLNKISKIEFNMNKTKVIDIIKTVICRINKNQDKKIYDLTLELIFNHIYNISIFSFLDVKPEQELNEKSISHKLNILRQISLDSLEKTNEFNRADKINSYLTLEKVNDNTLLNLYHIIYFLNKTNDSLLNCVKKNKYLVFHTFYVLLKNLFHCVIKKLNDINNRMPELDKQYKTIFGEIVNFVNFYEGENNLNYSEHDILSLGESLHFFFHIKDKNFETLTTKMKLLLKKIKRQIFINPKSINLSDFNHIIENDIFALCSFMYFSIENIFKKDNEESKYLINFIFEHFLNSINPVLNEKYKPFKNLYNNLLTGIRLNTSVKSKTTDFCDVSFVTAYIYLKKIYPLYNPNILLYILTQKEEPKEKSELPEDFIPEAAPQKHEKITFNSFFKCLNDSNLRANLDKHLFLDNRKYMAVKGAKYNSENILKEIDNFICKYLIDLNYSENSIIFNYIEQRLNKEKTKSDFNQYLNKIVFNYLLPEENIANNNQEMYNKLMNLFSLNYTFYGFLDEDYKLNLDYEERMKKKIRIVKQLIRNSKSNIHHIKYGYSENILNKNNFMNLYYFLFVLKKQKITLLNFSENNYQFIIETINFLVNINDLMKNNLIINYTQDYEIKAKSEFIFNEIKLFFTEFFMKQEIRDADFIYKIGFHHHNKLNNLLVEYALYFNNNFYELISRENISNLELDNKYKEIKNVLSYIFYLYNELNNEEDSESKNVNYRGHSHKANNKFSKKKELKINDFCDTLKKLLIKDHKKFIDFFHHLLTFFKDVSNISLLKMIKIFLKTDIQKFFENLADINNLLLDMKNLAFLSDIDTIPIISYILNNSDYKFYSKLDLINNSDIYKDIKKSNLLLDKIFNKEASMFIFRKIEKSINRNNSKKLIEFIKNTINNKYIIEYLLSLLSENESKQIFNDNKEYQNEIILSLFNYSSINGYYILKLLLTHLSKYMPKNEFNSIIYSSIYDKKIFTLEYNIDNEKILNRENFLLSYALSYKLVNNYESIAVILSFCPFPAGIIQLFEYLNIEIDNFNFFNIQCFKFFSDIKNKEIIKQLDINFYNFIELAESIIYNKDFFYKLNDIEKFIFKNIIKIFILDLTPKEFEILTDKEITDAKKRQLENEEKKLFILLTLFELKGLQILPISKYYPSFYSKIQAFYNKFKSIIKINPICLKQPSDIKLYEQVKLLLSEKKYDYINERFPLCKNLLTIFLLEGKSNYPLNFDNNNLTSIHKLIIDLIVDNDIKPFYDNTDFKDFFRSINNINDLKKVDMNSYKLLIDSLLDFHQTSNIIIQNNDKEKKNYKWKNKNLLCVYLSYLEAINNICRFVILNYENNISDEFSINYFVEELSEEYKNRLNSIKNSINLNKIVFYIINKIDQVYNDPDIINFSTAIKNWINNYLRKDELVKKSKEELANILSYFKYLSLSCYTLLKFIKILDLLEGMVDYRQNLKEYTNNVQIELISNSNKSIAKQGTSDSFYKYGQELLNLINTMKNNKEVSGDENGNIVVEKINTPILVYFYFNEEKELFVESNTDILLVKFIYDKTLSIVKFLSNYEKEIKEEEKIIEYNEKHYNDNKKYKIKNDKDYYNIKNLIFINENISEEKMHSIFNDLSIIIDSKLNPSKKDGTYQMFKTFCLNNKDYICKYFENSAFDLFQPNYYNCIYLITAKIKQFLYCYLYPCLSFNNSLFNFVQNSNFHNYVDFTEIITSIKRTKYHPDEELNSAFQIKAINYLINDRSNLYIFLLELYDKISKKSRKNKINEIKDNFKIKLIPGEKIYYNSIIKTLPRNIEKKLNPNPKESNISEKSSIFSNCSSYSKKIKYKLKVKDFSNTKNKIFYSIVSVNPFKRKRTPILHYDGFIPNKNNFIGTNLDTINSVFLRNIIVNDKSTFFRNKRYYPLYPNNNFQRINFLNVFDYMLTIKKVDNERIIYASMNDISDLLKNYEDRNTFIKLLNCDQFINDYEGKRYFDFDEIEFDYKIPKFKNTSIKSSYRKN